MIQHNIKHFLIQHLEFFFLIFLLFNPISINAQNPGDPIDDINRPNLKYVEFLIKEKLDSIRLSNTLTPFINDSILYTSSRSHARYLTKELSLSHYQMGSKTKRTYQDRAAKFGAEDYYVSENLAQESILKKCSSGEEQLLTFSQLANRIIEHWSESDGCMVNILSPSHVVIGLASWYDPDKREVRVASSFATVTADYKAKHYSWLFPYAKRSDLNKYKEVIKGEKPPRKYEWGINPKPDKEALKNYRKIRRMINSIGMIYDNDSVFVVFSNPRGMEKLFVSSDDGLAIELVTRKQYACNALNKKTVREEEEFNVKGNLLSPVFRDELLGGIADAKRKPKLIIKNIGAIPEKVKSEDYILNLVVLKNKRIVDIISFNQAPSKVFDIALSLPPARDSLSSSDYFIPHLRRDTLKLRVFFDQNKADVKTNIGDSISSWVENKKVQRAGVYAYASVEGTEEINKNLTEQRANEIISYFQTRDGQNVPIMKVTQENWHKFFNDIKDSKHNFLTNLDKEHIRSYVNDKMNSQELEPLLARHRYVDLKILAYKVVNDVSIDGLAVSEYKDIYDSVKYTCGKQPKPCSIDAEKINRMELVQLFLFNRNLQKRVQWNEIDNLPINIYDEKTDVQDEPLAKLYYNKLRFWLSYYGENLSYSDSLQILKELNRFPNPDPIIAYNYFVLLLKENSVDNPEPFYRQNRLNELSLLISSLEETGFDPIIVERLKLYYNFKSAEQEYFVNRFGDFSKETENSLKFIYDYFTKYPPQETNAQDIAMFFSAFRKFDEAMLFVEPYAFSSKPGNKSLELYLKFYYTNPRVKQKTDFYQFLKDAGDVLTNDEWCSLFTGDWPINMQVFDHEPLQLMYCRMCGN